MTQKDTTATVQVRMRVTFDVDVGSFGGDWNVASLKKDAERAIQSALGHLQEKAREGGIRLHVVNTEGLRVFFNE